MPSAFMSNTNNSWCGKASTIHQVSRYIKVHQPSTISYPQVILQYPGSKRRPKKKSGPQTARLCDEIGRTFPGFFVERFAGHWKTHKEKTQQLGNNNLNDCFYISLEFLFLYKQISIILFYQLFGRLEKNTWDLHDLENIITSNGSVSSMIQKSKWIRINAQNLPSKMTSRLSSLNKLTSKSEPTIQFQTVTCLVRTHHQRVKLAFLSHALLFIEVFYVHFLTWWENTGAVVLRRSGFFFAPWSSPWHPHDLWKLTNQHGWPTVSTCWF